jgi:hypothetical protein
MTEPSAIPDAPADPPPDGQSARTPGWVKILGAVVLLLVLLVAVLHLTGNGPGPSSHLGSAAGDLLWP